METGNTVLVVWCEDTNEWGIVNGRSNKTWQRFPDTTVGIRDCIKAIHAIGYDAEILQGGQRAISGLDAPTQITGADGGPVRISIDELAKIAHDNGYNTELGGANSLPEAT
jgi:hypothetical protein